MNNLSKNKIIGADLIIFFAVLGLLLNVSFAYAKETFNKTLVNYKKLETGKGSVVYVNDKQAVWLLNDMTGDRAKIVAQKLDTFINSKKSARDLFTIKPFKEGNLTVVRGGGKLLFTADKKTADSFGVSPHELAFVWANDTRKALELPVLKHDYSSVVSRGGYNVDFQRRYLGQTIYGLASWYGTYFHGQRSSDGSRYNKWEFTAANKTLPFGTLVKVTNLKTNKSCVVRITDRGPYVGDRVIDLSRRAAKEIGMLGSGVSKVKLEIVGKY